MHRMRRVFATAGSVLALTVGFAGLSGTAHAGLLKAGTAQTFPDIAGDLNGQVSYHYDTASGVGTLQVTNTPAVLSTGPDLKDQVMVTDPAGSSRSETLQLKLDSLGNLRTGVDGNLFSVYGTTTVNGQSVTGLLLQGTPTSFGFQNTAGQPSGSTAFDVKVALTGGLLKDSYGPDAYIRVAPSVGTNFNGIFYKDFSDTNSWTNVQSLNPPTPSPIPEPSTFYILLACGGAAVLYRRRRGGIRLSDLSAVS